MLSEEYSLIELENGDDVSIEIYTSAVSCETNIFFQLYVIRGKIQHFCIFLTL